jgi:hypothetical protein
LVKKSAGLIRPGRKTRRTKCWLTLSFNQSRRMSIDLDFFGRIDEVARPIAHSLPDQKRCYSCGGLGHVRGDPKCTASNGAIWKGAPEGFKRRMGSGLKNPKPQAKGKKGGKGKGGSTQRNLGKRKADDTSKLPRHYWSRGNGFCKYADACRYRFATLCLFRGECFHRPKNKK